MGSHRLQAPNKDYISSNSFPFPRRIIKFTHNPSQSTGHKVKSNNEKKSHYKVSKSERWRKKDKESIKNPRNAPACIKRKKKKKLGRTKESIGRKLQFRKNRYNIN